MGAYIIISSAHLNIFTVKKKKFKGGKKKNLTNLTDFSCFRGTDSRF